MLPRDSVWSMQPQSSRLVDADMQCRAVYALTPHKQIECVGSDAIETYENLFFQANLARYAVMTCGEF